MYYVRRLIACFIDCFLITSIGFLSFVVNPNFKWEYLLRPSAKMLSPLGVLIGVVALVFLPYFKDCILGSTSIGKFIVGLKVVDATTNQKPKFYQLVFRNIAMYTVADPITVLITKNKKLGDIIVNTKVVDRKGKNE